jgi:hypothetical protein
MRTLLIVVHVLAGVVILAFLVRQLATRAHEVGGVRAQWDVDHASTEVMRAEMGLQKSLLTGLRARDPYVVELLARDRHSYSRPGEYTLPPAPTRPVDKSEVGH